jgi:hypothetical protein
MKCLAGPRARAASVDGEDGAGWWRWSWLPRGWEGEDGGDGYGYVALMADIIVKTCKSLHYMQRGSELLLFAF